MLTNFLGKLNEVGKNVPLHVTAEPKEEVRPFTRLNRETGLEEEAEFISNTLSGVIMSEDSKDGVVQALKIGINNNSTNRDVTPTQVMKSFYMNHEALMNGTKHMVVDLSFNPRGGEEGAHAFYPTLENLQVVDSDEAETKFIKNLTATSQQLV